MHEHHAIFHKSESLMTPPRYAEFLRKELERLSPYSGYHTSDATEKLTQALKTTPVASVSALARQAQIPELAVEYMLNRRLYLYLTSNTVHSMADVPDARVLFLQQNGTDTASHEDASRDIIVDLQTRRKTRQLRQVPSTQARILGEEVRPVRERGVYSLLLQDSKNYSDEHEALKALEQLCKEKRLKLVVSEILTPSTRLTTIGKKDLIVLMIHIVEGRLKTRDACARFIGSAIADKTRFLEAYVPHNILALLKGTLPREAHRG